MPLNDSAVFLPSVVHIFTAPVGGPAPTLAMVKAAPATAPAGWDDLGHSSTEEDIEFDTDGGDSEVKGSRQVRNLREITEATVDFLSVNSIQLTNDTLTLFYGPGGDTSKPGQYDAPSAFGTAERGVLLVFLDGAKRAGLWWPRTSIRRNGGIGAAADDFLRFPLRFTRLQASGQPSERWLADGLGATLAP
ncbi:MULTISPECIES: hypothetical protein [unclassified Crossiella]|uniref:phage tail tube protein n=1 Tax=unclassified Crossiella TaxID=2620835 RepID=UPI001FFF0D30|nr:MULTISPECIES: hypothetical protein [unclassified Crossiella]MCK2242320.1 hypothetical protein [Crossiella sp. S99.2]MCK2254649.1 hypothetical protein [Crossiella sp. S99.1]